MFVTAKRRILAVITILGLTAMLLHMADVGQHPHFFPQNRDADYVVRLVADIYFGTLLKFILIPYLIASVVLDALPCHWRWTAVAGHWLYLGLALPILSTTGPSSDVVWFAHSLVISPFIGAPVLLTIKALWLDKERR